jgi:IclR family transcriptional regulator, pca regulon regulatory protein
LPSVSLTNSLQRGLQVLETFTPSSPRMRLQEVVNKTGLPKVTVLRFLRTLTALKYLSYNSETKLYSLSPRVMSLGYTALSGMDVREAALPLLEQLSETTGQNVNLGILDGTQVVYVERIKRKQILNIDLHVGSRLNAYNSSIGQVILAYMDRAELDRIVGEILQDHEIAAVAGPKGEVLYKNLREVRRAGYALNDESYVGGVRAIGAPVFDHRGVVDAGINIPIFSHMVSREELLEKHLPPLLDTAERVSAARGFLKSAGKRRQR